MESAKASLETLDSLARTPSCFRNFLGDKILLSNLLKRGNNNFDLYRLVAALAVIWGHAYYIVPNAQGTDFIFRLTGYTFSGAVAVKLFFFLSGLLVTNSLLRGTSTGSFVINRFARIWPGLIVAVTVVTWIVGPAVTKDNHEDYFASSDVQEAYLHNLFVGPITNSIRQNLPNVFEGLPTSDALGTLWTIPFELFCYGFLVAGWSLFRVSRKWISLGLSLVLLVAAIYPTLNILPTGEISLAIVAFSFGSTAAFFQESIRINLPSVLALCALAFFAHDTIFKHALFMFACIGMAMFFSSIAPLLRIKLPGDYSYGVYLYGWPIQQVLSSLDFSTSTRWNQLATMALALACAVVSWHFIEKPMMTVIRRAGASVSKFVEPYKLRFFKRG